MPGELPSADVVVACDDASGGIQSLPVRNVVYDSEGDECDELLVVDTTGKLVQRLTPASILPAAFCGKRKSKEVPATGAASTVDVATAECASPVRAGTSAADNISPNTSVPNKKGRKR